MFLYDVKAFYDNSVLKKNSVKIKAKKEMTIPCACVSVCVGVLFLAASVPSVGNSHVIYTYGHRYKMENKMDEGMCWHPVGLVLATHSFL